MKFVIGLNDGSEFETNDKSKVLNTYIVQIFDRLSGREEPEWLKHASDCYISIQNKFSLSIYQSGCIVLTAGPMSHYLAYNSEAEGIEVCTRFVENADQILRLYEWQDKVPESLKGPFSKDRPGSLHKAVLERDLAKVKELIDSGIDINSVDGDGATALFTAVLEEQPEIVKLLLSKGADLTIKDPEGEVALDYASPKMTKLIQKELKG